MENATSKEGRSHGIEKCGSVVLVRVENRLPRQSIEVDFNWKRHQLRQSWKRCSKCVVLASSKR